VKLIRYLKTSVPSFFNYYPAWGYAACLVFGVIATFPFVTLISLLLVYKKKFSYIFFLFLGLTLIYFSPQDLPSLPESYEIEGVFYPKKKGLLPTFFGSHPLVSGVLKTPSTNYKISLLADGNSHFKDHVSKLRLAVLKKDDKMQIKVLHQKSIKKASWVFNLRESVFEKMHSLTQCSKHKESSQLLYALISGKVEGKLLKLQFKDHGLAHILALSGFHLNLILSFSHFFFQRLLKIPFSHQLGLVFLSLYTFLIGNQASIVRAYSMVVIGFFHKNHAINTLPLHVFSWALIFTILLSPTQVKDPGFILSFLATLSLITFNSNWNCLQKITKPNGLWEKLIFLWLKLLFMQLFLFITTAPILLYFFKSLHLSSIFYNLFLPFLFAIFMMLGIVSIFLKILWAPIGSIFQEFIYSGSDLILELIKRPVSKQTGLLIYPLPLFWFLFFLLVYFLLVFCSAKKKQVI